MITDKEFIEAISKFDELEKTGKRKIKTKKTTENDKYFSTMISQWCGGLDTAS